MAPAEETTLSIYTQVGGMKTFRRLADAFYDRIATDAFLCPMFPGSQHCARKHLALFLAQFFGGPADYEAQRGSPLLRMRHQPFAIGQEERDRWLAHMLAAMEEVGVPEAARTVMAEYFTSASGYLINQPAQPTSVSVGHLPLSCPISALADIGTSWNHLVSIDRIVDALHAVDLDAFVRLMDEPDTCVYLAKDRVAYRDILALAFATVNPGILQEAQERLRREPDLLTVRGAYGFTLLHEAAIAWNYVLVELLLDLGADANVTDNGGHPPLYYAANHVVSCEPHARKEESRVVRLLLQYNANVNAASGVKRVTALHMAARRGNVPIATALLEQGALLETRDSNGETPLRRAVNCGHPQMVALLLAHGADATTQDNPGATPLDAARTTEIRSILLAAMV